MKYPEQHYDELNAASDYIWCHHRDLISASDRRIEFVMQFRWKTRKWSNKDRVCGELERFTEDLSPSEIETSHGDIFDFRRKIAARILDTRGDAISFNRCPSCNRIVRTPKAQQCFWCGHDWH